MQKVFCLNNRHKVNTLVITGGPCGGKTTIVNKLREKFGDQAVFVPEAATLLLSGGFPIPDRDLTMCPEWEDSFQTAVITVQLSLEKMYRRAARQTGLKLMICDRGIFDHKAYITDVCYRNRIDPKKMLAHYDRVIHLESLATAAPKKYGKDNNPYRLESLAQAKALEYCIRTAWQDHPRRLILLHKNYPTLDDVFEKVTEVVQELLK